MADQINVQIIYEAIVNGSVFRDALYFTEAEYAVVKQADIDAEKSRRIAAWQAARDAPPPVRTKAEVLAIYLEGLANLDAARADTVAKIATVQAE